MSRPPARLLLLLWRDLLRHSATEGGGRAQGGFELLFQLLLLTTQALNLGALTLILLVQALILLAQALVLLAQELILGPDSV